MIIVLERGTTPEQAAAVLKEVNALGLDGRLMASNEKPLIHVQRGPTRFTRRLVYMDRVEGLVPTSGPRVRREGRRFYPYHFVNWCAGALMLMGALVVLAGFLPPGLGPKLDIQHPPAAADHTWYLRALDRMAAFLPGWLAWLLGLALLVALFALPSLDRSSGTRLRERWPATLAAGALAVVVLYLVMA